MSFRWGLQPTTQLLTHAVMVMTDRRNGSRVICHDLVRGLLRGRCHLRLSHSWPLWNKTNRRQTVCAPPCVGDDQIRLANVSVSSVALFAWGNHAWWVPSLSPLWCKKIPLWTLERWSLTRCFSSPVSFFLSSSHTLMTVICGASGFAPSSPKIRPSSPFSYFHSLTQCFLTATLPRRKSIMRVAAEMRFTLFA